jgi:hypothetical protein
MKQTLLASLLFVFFLPLLSPAQDSLLKVSTTLLEEEFMVDLSDLSLRLELKIDVINNSDDTLKLKWERFVLNQPENWETQGCDNNRCWLPFVDTNYDEAAEILEPFVLPPDSSFVYILYLLPNGQAGSGNYMLDFSEISRPDSILAAIDLTATVSSSTTSTFSQKELKDIYVFPNPAVNSFRITNDWDIDQVVIRNVLGRQVRTFVAYPGASYRVYDLPQGVYLVSLLDETGKSVKTIRLIKQRFRP